MQLRKFQLVPFAGLKFQLGAAHAPDACCHWGAVQSVAEAGEPVHVHVLLLSAEARNSPRERGDSTNSPTATRRYPVPDPS